MTENCEMMDVKITKSWRMGIFFGYWGLGKVKYGELNLNFGNISKISLSLERWVSPSKPPIFLNLPFRKFVKYLVII